MNARLKFLMICGVTMMFACGDEAPAPDVSVAEMEQMALGRGVKSAIGAGNYLFAGSFDIENRVVALELPNGRSLGWFRQSLILNDQLIDFTGRVTCLAVDSENGRAWIGGVVLRNGSEDPNWQMDIHQPGKDVWFRVLDNGRGPDAEADRSTFLGFEGAGGIITSEEYCEAQVWPDNNDRTHPFTTGGVRVRP